MLLLRKLNKPWASPLGIPREVQAANRGLLQFPPAAPLPAGPRSPATGRMSREKQMPRPEPPTTLDVPLGSLCAIPLKRTRHAPPPPIMSFCRSGPSLF